MIEALCRTADGAVQVTFDATSWFETADPEQIQNLVGSGWEGRRGAAIALFLMDRDAALLELFRYILILSALWDVPMPFTCRIDRDQALAWLRQHAPEWYRGLDLAEEECSHSRKENA
jgi:hypothetical protein